MKYNALILSLLTLGLIYSCSPKTTVAEVAEVEEEVVVDPNLSPCKKFSDAFDPDQIEDYFVLYRDDIKNKNYTSAFEYWQQVYKEAPAADGKRNTVFTDGVFFFERLARGAEDEETKQKYVNKMFELYDEMEDCYPSGDNAEARKAFDLFFKFPELSTPDDLYNMFKKAVDEGGEEAEYFILNPFTSLLVDQYEAGKISQEEAFSYQEKVRNRLEKGLEECEGKNCEYWDIISNYVPLRLEAFEVYQGFYDCDYYYDKYYTEFVNNPEDCEIIRTVYSRLKWGGCTMNDEKYKALLDSANENCVEKNSLKAAYAALREANYSEAIKIFKEVESKEENPEEKAIINLLIAKVYYVHLKSFSKARDYARIAAKQKPNWGEPYLLIGRLYASSGPLCGPGRGWDSQIVVWPAIDKWKYAKSIDPSAAAEANKWINQYSQYMPNVEDIFIRGLSEGQSFRVPCWIQENTTIRAAK